jgi:hypothetical protein
VSGGAEYVAVSRGHSGESKLLTAEALGALFTITASLNAVASLQLFIPSHGGNGTQYVCEYSRDGVDTYYSKCAVSKLAFVGLQGPEAMAGDVNVGVKEEPQALPCNFRRLNEELCSATRRLVRCCEENARCRVMACTARFVLDPRGVPWFVGAKDVVTIPRAPRETRANTVILRSSSSAEMPFTARAPFTAKAATPSMDASASALGVDAAAFPLPCEGDYCLHPVVPSPGRGDADAEVDFVTGAATLLPAAEATAPVVGYHSVAHRTILLDRALQRRGVGLGDAAPEEALRLFLAEERRHPAAHAREASVCDRCAAYYELFRNRRRVEEGLVRRAMRAEAEEAAARAAAQAAAQAAAARAAADAFAAAVTARGRFSVYKTESSDRGSPPSPARAHPLLKDRRVAGGKMRGSQSTPSLRGVPFGQRSAGPTNHDPAGVAAEAALGVASTMNGRGSEVGLRLQPANAGSVVAVARSAERARAGSVGMRATIAGSAQHGGSAMIAHAYDAARESRPRGAWLPAVGGRDGLGASAVEAGTSPVGKVGEGRGVGSVERAVRGQVMQRMAIAYALPAESGWGANGAEKRRPQLAAIAQATR